ncbi:MAG: hypothetical protein HDR32_02240 [Treponema sp.]|nr:hypothetical protein [Treponema sp.]
MRTALSAVRAGCNWLSTFRATGCPYPVQLAAYGVCDQLFMFRATGCPWYGRKVINAARRRRPAVFGVLW